MMVMVAAAASVKAATAAAVEVTSTTHAPGEPATFRIIAENDWRRN